MNGLCDGKVVIVTGAGGGVGEGIAGALAQSGAHVVLAVRRLETGEPVAAAIRAAGGSATAVRCDVARRSDVDAVVRAALDGRGRLDAVVHNALAPAGDPHGADDVDDDVWARMMSTAVRASYWLALAGRAPLRQSQGSLILLVSQTGIEGSHALPAYAAVKGAQRGFAKSLAREWGPDGIRVNCIAPVALTPAMRVAYANRPELEARMHARVALGRVGEAQADIGGVVAFLVSDLARYVTGQTLVVDGGGFML